MNELQVLNIEGVDCYEQDGIVYLKLENVAKGLGFTTVATSGNEIIRWKRVEGYLTEIGFQPQVAEDIKDSYIPENVFYRLAMKAKNKVGEMFQAKVADEIIPSIRRNGSYSAYGKGATKKFKALTEKGLKYGENAVNTQNQKEVQPLYYCDTFMELYNNVT